jgi:hypothetical protein
VAFAFAIAANVIAAIASLLTGRRKPAGAAPEAIGAELAAVAAEGGLEPSELIGPGPGAQGAPESRGNGQSPAVTESSRKEPG